MFRAAIVLACLVLVTACGDTSNGGITPSGTSTPPGSGEQMRTMTEQQAAQRAQEHIDRAVAALPETPTLNLLDDSSMECLDPTDGGPRGRYEVGKTYWLDGLPTGRNPEFVNALHQHWLNSGFRVLSDQRTTPELFVSVQNNDDAFRMSITQSDEGSLSLGASSPCVWPNGVPPEEDAGS